MSKPNVDFLSPATARPPDNLPAAGTADSPAELCGCRPPASTGAMLLRTAECLRSLLQAPTVHAGLNESRYNVLDALRRKPSGTCSQTELAKYLLQSESNLSTLLDRMNKDGLISRVRSQSDRRIARIGLSAVGREALARADQARQRVAAQLLRAVDERLEAALGEALELLRRNLEHTLGVAGRVRTTIDVEEAALDARDTDAAVEQIPDRVGRCRTDALESYGAER